MTLYHLTSILRFYYLCFHSSGLGYGEIKKEEGYKSKRIKTDLGLQHVKNMDRQNFGPINIPVLIPRTENDEIPQPWVCYHTQQEDFEM